MDETHRQVLTRNLTKFTDQLEVNDVLPWLRACDVLTDGLMEEFHVDKSRSDKALKLIQLLKRRGPNAFVCFYGALYKTNQLHLAHLLEPYIPEDQRLGAKPQNGAGDKQNVEFPRDTSSASMSKWQEPAPPTYEEIMFAEQYYKAHLPSYIDENVLNQVPATVGVIPDLRIEAVDAVSVDRRPIFDDNEHYYNFSKPKGLALVFNNRKFATLPTRTGTDVDAQNIQSLLKDLGYEVKVKQDHTAREMVAAMGRLALKTELETIHSVIVFVLTHGEHGQLYGSDDELINIAEFTSILNADRCPALRDKPKLFFLQACRGKDYDRGHGDYTDSVSMAVDSGVLSQDHKEKQVASMSAVEKLQLLVADHYASDMVDAIEIKRRIPSDADIFIGYATTPGYVSWRNSARGSWYIQSIVDVFRRYAHYEDLLSMMTKVNRQVAEVFASSSGGFKQVPEPCSRLRKKFYFFPGRHHPTQL